MSEIGTTADGAAPAEPVVFPEGRHLFTSQEAMQLIGMPVGSRVIFQYLVIHTRVHRELVGTTWIFGRDAVETLFRAYEQRKAESARKAAEIAARRANRVKGRRGRPARPVSVA